MGFDPEAVGKMSLWKYLAVLSDSSEPGLSDDEFNALAEIV